MKQTGCTARPQKQHNLDKGEYSVVGDFLFAFQAFLLEPLTSHGYDAGSAGRGSCQLGSRNMAVYGLDDSDLDEFLESESSASENGSPALLLALQPKAAEPLQPLLTTVSLRGPDASHIGEAAQDACKIVPANRWDADTGWEGERTQAPKRFGSFIGDAELFDADLFGSPQQEASAMDAQQRLLLEGCWEALSHSSTAAGLTGDAAKGVAVTVGISYTEYYLNYRHQGLTAYTATSGTLSVVCGRLSFTLGLKGPSISIDTACSSSLVGAHIACTSFLSETVPESAGLRRQPHDEG